MAGIVIHLDPVDDPADVPMSDLNVIDIKLKPSTSLLDQGSPKSPEEDEDEDHKQGEEEEELESADGDVEASDADQIPSPSGQLKIHQDIEQQNVEGELSSSSRLSASKKKKKTLSPRQKNKLRLSKEMEKKEKQEQEKKERKLSLRKSSGKKKSSLPTSHLSTSGGGGGGGGGVNNLYRSDSERKKFLMQPLPAYELLPGYCEHACNFNLMAFACCAVFVALPILLFLGVGDQVYKTSMENWFIAGAVLLAIGVLIFCLPLRYFFADKICCKLPPCEHEGAFVMADETYQRVQVRKIYVVVNPYGGLRTGPRILNEICMPIWKENKIEVSVLETKHAGHARELMQNVDLKGYDAVCVIGGDGTVAESVNGLLTREDGLMLPLCIIPGGSGNSVAKDLGIKGPKEAALRLVSGDTVAMDTLKLEDEGQMHMYSINVVGVGLLAHAGGLSERARCCGPKRYDMCGLWSIFTKPEKRYGVVIDDQDNEGDKMYTILFIQLNQYMGKGLRAAPTAKLDDGLLDLIMSRERLNRGQLFSLFQQLPSGSHRFSSAADIRQVKKVRIAPGESNYEIVIVDGELYRCDGRLSVECLKHALRIFAPRDSKSS